MATLSDSPMRYGVISRVLHWGMAALFAAQFLSAAAHWALPRENALREALWSYHSDLGATLFLLVMVRGIWGLVNIPNRPKHSGTMGLAATAGHIGLYGLMVIVPASRILAAAGGTRGYSYLGFEIFAPNDTKIAWTQVAAEWHGEMGWILALLVLGHITFAVVYHKLIRKDGVYQRMA